MERRIVEHDNRAALEKRQKFRCQPFVENIRVASAVEQPWGDQFFAEIPANQAGARTSGSGFFPVYFLSDECPSMRAMNSRREAGFIDKDNIPRFVHGLVKMLQEASAFTFIILRFRVPRGFFYG